MKIYCYFYEVKSELFPFTVELANEEHVEDITQLIRLTAKWLKTKGINQWSESYPSSRVVAEIHANELYVILDQSKKIIGALSICQSRGDLWPLDNTPAIYLNRLVICRECSGCGLGAQIIQWVIQHVRQKRYPRLRLNCDKSNLFLADFYRNSGFTLIGEFFYEPWRMTFNLFEKNI